jgi:hypothetical protein
MAREAMGVLEKIIEWLLIFALVPLRRATLIIGPLKGL